MVCWLGMAVYNYFTWVMGGNIWDCSYKKSDIGINPIPIARELLIAVLFCFA